MPAFVLRSAGSSLRTSRTLRAGSLSGNQVAASGTGTFTLAGSATGSLRIAAAGTATFTLSGSGTAGQGVAAITWSQDESQRPKVVLSAFGTATVLVPVELAPTGSTVAAIKRVSITMPAPVLDAQGRPT